MEDVLRDEGIGIIVIGLHTVTGVDEAEERRLVANVDGHTVWVCHTQFHTVFQRQLPMECPSLGPHTGNSLPLR